MGKNLIGERFSRLVVLSKLPYHTTKDSLWLCKCDCGVIKNVLASNLRKEKGTQSCGCLQKELVAKRSLTHGMAHTPEYKAWLAMKSRCYNPKTEYYNTWGGRGIIVCDRWLNSFEDFFEDMGLRPSNNHSLDRFPDVNGNYEPSNCRWGTDEQQHRNKRTNNWVEYKGEVLVVQDWAIKFGIPQSTLDQRLRRGHEINYVMSFSENPLNKGKRLV